MTKHREPNSEFDGKVALITGAGSGIGKAMAALFAAAGASVAALDIDASRAEATAELIRRSGGKATAVCCDVSKAASVEEAVGAATDQLGSVSIACCNAGILDDYAPVLETSEALWDSVLGVNLKGVFLTAKAVLPQMLALGGGVIISTASISGFVAGGGGAAYTASKHGVIGLSRQISLDYGSRGIRSNAICPGPVETAMTRDLIAAERAPVMEAVQSAPAGRFAQPEEVARLALFLASEDSAFMHGAAVVIDGGWTIR